MALARVMQSLVVSQRGSGRPESRRRFVASAVGGLIAGALPLARASAAPSCPAFMSQAMPRLHSAEQVDLCKLSAGRALLIVNTASHCGYTPQFKGLEALHKRYASRGLVVIGFASDDFRQEARSQAEAAQVCYQNYGVTFTMIAPSHVKGRQANPVFQELIRQAGAPEWNFNKYLVGADGRVRRHFASAVTPDSSEMASAIEALLR